MKYSQQVLDMLKRGVNGDVDDYYDFFLELTSKLGEDEAFADGLIAENEPLFDLINDEPMYYFYVEEDTEDRELCRRFLEPYYNKAKQLVKLSAQFNLGLRQKSKIKSTFDRASFLPAELIILSSFLLPFMFSQLI